MIFFQKCMPKKELMYFFLRRIASVVMSMPLLWSYEYDAPMELFLFLENQHISSKQ